MTKRFAIKIAYIGKEYQGFQRQTESIKTVEGSILNALIELEIINATGINFLRQPVHTDENPADHYGRSEIVFELAHLLEYKPDLPDALALLRIASTGKGSKTLILRELGEQCSCGGGTRCRRDACGTRCKQDPKAGISGNHINRSQA